MYMHKKKPSGSEFFNIRSLCSESDKASAAVDVYTFTGCDSVEAFFGLGKLTAMKRILQSDNVSYYQTIQQLGSSDEFLEQLLLDLELLTIRVIYNDPVSETLAHARTLETFSSYKFWVESRRDRIAACYRSYFTYGCPKVSPISNEEVEEQEADEPITVNDSVVEDSDMDKEVEEQEGDEPIIVNDSAVEDSDTDDE
ncbi:unnamed protein product [Ceutorhynchus assimilis]|uniref:Uncharacterized protein n=1 Tax=Ceutorhynchus assimilis TaxID=467358 RepID=A0A9N9MV88_9CUCU|nr:unnamed protein product [Ceutorhynchus assimilis]